RHNYDSHECKVDCTICPQPSQSHNTRKITCSKSIDQDRIEKQSPDMRMKQMIELMQLVQSDLQVKLNNFASKYLYKSINYDESVGILIDELIGTLKERINKQADFQSACINALKKHEILHEKSLVFTKKDENSNLKKFISIQNGLHLSQGKLSSLLTIIGAPPGFESRLNRMKRSYLSQFGPEVCIKDKFAMVKPNTLMKFIVERDKLTPEKGPYILKFDIDANRVTKTNQQYQNMAFEIIYPSLSTKDCNSPRNSHTFMIYKFRKANEESNSALTTQLQEVRAEIEAMFKTKELVIDGKSIIKFKDVVFSSDLAAWVKLLGLKHVFHPKTPFICPICNVGIAFLKNSLKITNIIQD
ncbi:MAG: hypothetical protein Q8T08_02725, partial [Ignavibacteria bacterium]|nr:hypothetical protein [Ignavibacteria bacterium]